MNEPRTAAPATDAALDERELLVIALAERMREFGADARSAAAAVRSSLVDGAEALDRLRQSLALARERTLKLEAELRDLRASPASAQVEGPRMPAGAALAHDPLGPEDLSLLPCRGQFLARLVETIDAARSDAAALAVLFIDLDGFQPIDVHHGPAIGDALLDLVAQRLHRCVRRGDSVCQLGRQEFACLPCDPLDRAQLERLATKLHDAVSVPLQVGALTLTLRPRIAVAVCPRGGDRMKPALQRRHTTLRQDRPLAAGPTFDRRDDA